MTQRPSFSVVLPRFLFFGRPSLCWASNEDEDAEEDNGYNDVDDDDDDDDNNVVFK